MCDDGPSWTDAACPINAARALTSVIEVSITNAARDAKAIMSYSTIGHSEDYEGPGASGGIGTVRGLQAGIR